MQRDLSTLSRNRSLLRAAAIACCGLLLGSLAWTPRVRAQAWVPGKGQGSLSIVYKQKQSTKLTDGGGNASDFGKAIVRTMNLDIDYGLTDRLAVSVGLPFGSNRYTGNDPHDPRSLPFANDQRFLDDGRFHGGWTDFSIGLRYQWRTQPFLITPFIAYSWPSHNYTFFAHSALGNQQWTLQAGVHAGDWLPPPLQNLYWEAGYAYSFMQPLSHRRINHGTLHLQVGSYVTPRLELHLLAEHSNSYGPAINLPQDFFNPDGTLNPDNLYYHDQLAAARMNRASVGLSYQLNDRYQLSADLGRNFNAANVHRWDYEASIGISRSFSWPER